MTEIDVIIISYAKTDELVDVTKFGIETLSKSEDPSNIKFNIVVVESNHEISYDDFNVGGHSIKTIYPEVEFGYHTYLNLGLKEGSAEWTCLCNNDLEFTTGWASNMLYVLHEAQKQIPTEHGFISASPYNPKEPNHKGMERTIEAGLVVRKHVAGWCLFQKREMFETFGMLDERIKFWFADNFYAVYCDKFKIPHLLVGPSVVYHHEKTEGTTTTKIDLDDKVKHDMTYGAGDNFREVCRDFLNNPNFGVFTEEQKKEMERKSGRKFY